TALPAGLLQKLLVLLLPHLLAALLDDRGQTFVLSAFRFAAQNRADQVYRFGRAVARQAAPARAAARSRSQSVPNRLRRSTRRTLNPVSSRTEPSFRALGASATGEISRRT